VQNAQQYLNTDSGLQACNEKPHIIQEYESGKAIPNPQVLSKMSRVLGVPLSKRGPKPAAAPAKKK
jgi:ribosome-binding protein aMBF1 (putative translation factor)